MPENSLSLSELNGQVSDAIRDHLPDTYWVRAETSDVRLNRNGHCYLEFIEKDARGQNIVARARGVIWNNVYEMLSSYFETETGQPFVSGLSILVRVSVDFHELYGFSLSVVDIDPSFTIGEIARNRQLVLRKLEEEGVLTLNKELTFPELTNRIAVISSPTAAGYEDFCDQLAKNPYGFVFYTRLFPAIMQGERSEPSVIAALEKIYAHKEHFDAVTIIRGGGSSSDLSCFDSYYLATNCAQFPLPVISGIGHERDITVIDIVAHTRAKTPTAVAELLISHASKTAVELMDLQQRLVEKSGLILQSLQDKLGELSRRMIHSSRFFVREELSVVQQLSIILNHQAKRLLQAENHSVAEKSQYIHMASPENILKRGYTLTLKNGKIIKSATELSEDDIIETLFTDGKAESIITKK
ncbi:MAG: exodeoxyribonuclease VII large subunit [Petrimonas sp.]|jgi:exodeoxyribonuclease VII large subunit|uniref:Exodeoxyribonuclease 7 large subunit n=1 Tax=bioreactor metagenome TaxID=1076179 RepID=A0A644WLY1_9ZZZZ|nr:exodeoxyribonuclease VII large subunit [Petrimonas sp.]HAC73775.1 exodeoxyribonuclease VII large subunit [Porphyromonadaceae bacterium]MDD4015897.1 exodeoxyribonuclease VII large subunit [Petrimonas sp.]MDX9775107.1 exodeoxyribonuclease VII large subunit [Petrimonas sp.]MEA5072133.1 exodeoxyribonuclease VII large subunit [Petrimonas sp.]